MKIALIDPPSPFLISDKVFPNIGLLRVATALNQDHQVRFFDISGQNGLMSRIAKDFDYYLFTSTSPNFQQVYKLHRQLKKANPKAKTIIGGAHASAISVLRRNGLIDVNTQRLEEFDTVFEGEGEETSNIFKPGWQRGRLIKDIDDFPIPDRGLIDLKSYEYSLFGKPTTSIQTQRGCPYQCTFCSGRDVEMYNHVRFHSVERVLKEMDELNRDYGFKSFMWYDDEININPKRLEELCLALEKRDYQHRGFVRSDLIVKHPELVQSMKMAGFVKLCTGVESGSDDVLKRIRKGTTYQINLEAARIIQEAGIHYEAFLMVGHPGEKWEDVSQTIDWIREARPDDFDINVVTPFPGSTMYDQAIKSKRYPAFGFEYKGAYFNRVDFAIQPSFYKGIAGRSATRIRTDFLTNIQIHQIREEIERLKNIK